METIAEKNTLQLTDTHCHLNLLDLQPFAGEMSAVLAEAKAAGVGRFVCIGVEALTQPEVLALAKKFPEVYATVGIHPNHVHEHPVNWDCLTAWAREDKVVAIGETGLDYHYTPEHAPLQQEIFSGHVDLARRLNLPLVVHTREAAEDTLAILRSAGSKAGVMHCFTETWEVARKALDLGFYISFSGVVTFKNAGALREVARKVPDDCLLIETDSPWLAPVPHRGKHNRPAWVLAVATVLAEIRNCSLESLAEQTTCNASRLFGFPLE